MLHMYFQKCQHELLTPAGEKEDGYVKVEVWQQTEDHFGLFVRYLQFRVAYVFTCREIGAWLIARR